MARRIVLLGATGYTGRLIAERLAARGERPVLAGRNDDKLADLASRLGELQYAHADVMRQNSIFALVEEDDVLVSTVGPFAKWGDPAVRAAISAGATYIDSTGEPSFIRRVFEEFGPPARRAGAALLTAMGYDWVPGSLAGALALEEAGEEAVRVDVGYYALGIGSPTAMSEGTRLSSVGALLTDSFAYRGGRIQTVRTAERVRSFTVAGKQRPAVAVGAAEHFSLPAAYPRVREINAYLGWFGPLARPLQYGSLAGSFALRVPGVRPALQFAGERLAGMGGGPEPGTTPGGISWIAAEAYDARGNQLAEVHLRGVDGYEFTAAFMAWAAARAASAGVEGSGALGPVQAFGLETLERGCAEAGIERVRAPAAV